MTDKYRNTPKGRIAPNGYRLCDPLSEGEVLSDIQKQQWVIGKPIGCGGFGEIYLCHDKSDSSKKNYVMKLDNKCGPLFVEVNFVIRACSSSNVKAFMDSHKLEFLGIPTFIASGTHQVGKNGGYRFLVMDRLGEELQNVLEKTRLSIPVTCRIASRIIDALEFIHEQGYIHADIKAQNILRAMVNKIQTKKRTSKRAYEDMDDNVDDDDKYYLIDYGLVERYTLKGVHKPYEFDKRTANNGTCEFRSRDAHIGVISRRSDIESLGYNIILWFYGHHPWANMVKNADQVHEKKCWAMNNIDAFLKEAFGDKSATETETDTKAPSSKSKAVSKKNIPSPASPPKGLNKFFEEIKELSHDAKPDYCKLKNILSEIAELNSVESTRTSSNGNKKKSSNGIVSSAKKTITKNKRKSETIEDDSVDAPTVKSKRALTTKVPLKSKSNLFVVNGASNGASIDESFNEDTEEDEDIYEPFKKSSTKPKPKLKNLSAKKVNGTRNKRHSLASSLKKNKPVDKLVNCKTPNRPLRNRIKLDDDIDLTDEDVKEIKPIDVKYTNGTEKKVRRIPRLSTPLIAMTPPEGGDSPLFGPFEPDDSIKENRILPNPTNRSNNISSFLQNDDEDTQDRHLRTCRIYINNKRCLPPQTSDISAPILNNSASHPHLSTSNSSSTIEEEEDIKPILTNGKLNKRPISNTKKTKPTVVRKVNNGKAKTNGHILSSTPSSSKSTSTARKNRLAKTLPTEDSSSAPVSNKSVKESSSATTETAAMQKIRMMIQKKRQSITSINKK